MQVLKKKSVEGLRFLERYTKTDMVYLASGGFWAFISQVATSLATFLLAIAFAHFVSKDAYGQYKYVLSIAGILGTFTLNGLGTAVVKSITGGFEGTLNYAFWKNLKWSLIFVGSTFCLAIYYFINGNFELGISLLVVGSFWPFWTSTNLYNAYLLAKKDFKRSSIYYNIIGNIFPSLCIFIAILITSNPTWLVSIFFISNALVGITLYLRVIKIYRPNNKVDTGVLGYSKHLSVIGILGGLSSNIDQVLIFHYIGPVQLAIYNFALAIPNQIKGPIKSLAGLVFPKFTERSEEEIRAGMKNKFLWIFMASLIIVATYILIAPYVFHTFFPKYIDSIFYSQIISLSLLSMISLPAEIYFVAKEKVREQYISNIAISILQITITFIFVLWKGVWGVVMARVLVRILWSMINIYVYEKSAVSAVSKNIIN